MPSSLTPEQRLHARFWIDTIGADIAKCNSKSKDPSVEKWGTNIDREMDYGALLKAGHYDQGMDIICGQLRYGTYYKGKWLTVFDFDILDAFQKFLDLIGMTLDELAQWTRVEWHHNPAKLHVFFLSDKPFRNVMSGRGLEVYAQKKLVFVSPSVHKDGIPYQPYGTKEIVLLSGHIRQMQVEAILEAFMNEFGVSYWDDDSVKQYVEFLEKPDTILEAGQRHYGLKALACSWFNRLYGSISQLTDEQRLQRLFEYNQKQCNPPKPEQEIVGIWDWVQKTFTDSRKKKLDELLQEAKAKLEKKKNKKKIKEGLHLINNLYRFATLKDTDEILFYRDGIYHYGGENLIRKSLQEIFGDETSISMCREIVDHIRRQTYHDRSEFDADLDVINLKNCLYNLRTGEYADHTSDYLSLNQKPIIFDPNAPVPTKFIKFLKQVTYSTDVWTLIQLIAYTFYRDNPFEIIVILHGSGSNGKSVLFAVITALHGSDNVSNVSLKHVAESRFGLYDLVAKDVNLDAELSSGVIEDTSMLKKLTGRQLTRVEDKYKSAFDVKLHAKLWLSANKIPQTKDDSDAWYRRNIIISFPNTFSGKNEDPDLISKLATEEELSGIFNLLMFTLRQVLAQGTITVGNIQDRRNKYEMASDPIHSFILEAISKQSVESNSLTKKTLYAAYRHFCSKYKLAMESYVNFCRILKQRYNYQDGQEPTGDRRRIWQGLALSAEYVKVVAANPQVEEDD
jgi:putative DNA primase/helicase